MLEFEHSFIAQICGRCVQPEDVKAILDIVKPYLSDEQILEINKNAQESFDDMCKTVLDNPEDFGLV